MFVLIWLLSFHLSFASDEESPLRQLLLLCFDPQLLANYGPPKGDLFTIKGKDAAKLVEIEFSVTGDGQGGCTLEVNLREEKDFPLSGIISSLDINTNQQIQLRDPNGHTCIRIFIYATDQGIEDPPYWELINLCPNGLVSGKFIRSFIVQGLFEHSLLLSDQIPLTLADQSSIRELYWLGRGNGKTYYEDQWNLEYDYFNCIEPELLEDFNRMSAKADRAQAGAAFRDTSFQPIEVAGELFTFAPAFTSELEKWVSKYDRASLNNWTIRRVLNEFIPSWVFQYNDTMKQVLAQNTFLYFFRHHLEFEELGRRVLVNQIADLMTGYPLDDDPIQFEFKYEKVSSPIKRRRVPRSGSSESSQAGTSSGSPTSVSMMTPTSRFFLDSLQLRVLVMFSVLMFILIFLRKANLQ